MTQQVQVRDPKPKKKLFVVAALAWTPTAGTRLILEPQNVVAKDEGEARLLAAKRLPDADDANDEEQEILVRPF